MVQINVRPRVTTIKAVGILFEGEADDGALHWLPFSQIRIVDQWSDAGEQWATVEAPEWLLKAKWAEYTDRLTASGEKKPEKATPNEKPPAHVSTGGNTLH